MRALRPAWAAERPSAGARPSGQRLCEELLYACRTTRSTPRRESGSSSLVLEAVGIIRLNETVDAQQDPVAITTSSKTRFPFIAVRATRLITEKGQHMASAALRVEHSLEEKPDVRQQGHILHARATSGLGLEPKWLQMWHSFLGGVDLGDQIGDEIQGTTLL